MLTVFKINLQALRKQERLERARPQLRRSGKMSLFCSLTDGVMSDQEETIESMYSNISDTEMPLVIPLAASPAIVSIPPVTLLPVTGARKFSKLKLKPRVCK